MSTQLSIKKTFGNLAKLADLWDFEEKPSKWDDWDFGKEKVKLSDGSIYTGDLVDGKRVGYGKIIYQDGR